MPEQVEQLGEPLVKQLDALFGERLMRVESKLDITKSGVMALTILIGKLSEDDKVERDHLKREIGSFKRQVEELKEIINGKC